MTGKRAASVFLGALCIAGGLQVAPGHAQDWEAAAGPYGGYVMGLVRDADGRIFAGTFGGGVYVSTDDAATWAPAGAGIADRLVTGVGVTAAGHVLAGTFEGRIYRSTDHGATWTGSDVSSEGITCFVEDSTGRLIAGSGGFFGKAMEGTNGLYRSTDGGVTWEQVNEGLTVRDIRKLAVDSADRLFASSWYGGVYRSLDGGDHWTAVNSGLSGNQLVVTALHVRPDDSLLIATFQDGIFRSADHGVTWTQLWSGYLYFPQAIVENAAGTLFLASDDDRMRRSVDGGTTWTEHWVHDSRPRGRALLVDDADRLFLGAAYNLGVYRSDDDGATWARRWDGLGNAVVHSLARDATGALLAGVEWGGAWRSTDEGRTWTQIGLDGTLVYSVAVGPTGDILAGCYPGNHFGILRTRDYGATWEQLNLFVFRPFAIAFNGSGHIFVCNGEYWGGGVSRSTDDGLTWTSINDGLPAEGTAQALVVAPDGRLYLGYQGGDGLYKSTDNGDHWVPMNAGLPFFQAQALARAPSGVLFAASPYQGVYRSADDGASWVAVNDGLTTLEARALHVDDAGNLWLGTHGGGVFVSGDLGASWIQMADGLTDLNVSALATAASGRVCAGTEHSGVFTADGPPPPPENVVFDPDPQQLSLADDAGGGVYRDGVVCRYLGGASGPLYGYSLQVTWDSGVVAATPADFQRPDSGPFHDCALFFVLPVAGGVQIDAALGGAGPGIAAGELFRATFTAAGDGTTPLDLTLLRVRDAANAALSGLVEDDGEIVVDLTAPVVAGAFIANVTLAHTDDFMKNTDHARLTATVTDAGSGVASVLADLSGLGGGAAVPPDSYAGGLATWDLASAACTPADGTVTVTVTATDNVGNSALGSDTIVADNTPPEPLEDLTVAPGYHKVTLGWGDPTDNDAHYRGVLVRYAKWTGYPVYADPMPAHPADKDAGDGAAYDGAGGGGGAVHDFGMDWHGWRGVYAYAGFVYDQALNYSAAANPPPASFARRATNYWLGDVFRPEGCPDPCDEYDGLVGVGDVTVLGANYGAGAGSEADVGPTHDTSRLGIPRPDGVVDFEDLMIFAMNFGVVAPRVPPEIAVSAPALRWAQADERTWVLWLDAPCPSLQGLRVTGSMTGATGGVPANVAPGSQLGAQRAPWFLRNIAARGLDAGLAVLGTGVGIAGAGELLRVTLPAGAALSDLRVEARSVANEVIGELGASPDTPPVPAAFRLHPTVPNPFNPVTRIACDLAAATRVTLAIYDVSGRLVRTLVAGADLPAGRHEAVWDGRDDRGGLAAAGIYYCRLSTPEFEATRSMALVK